jgi:hypothetical protein
MCWRCCARVVHTCWYTSITRTTALHTAQCHRCVQHKHSSTHTHQQAVLLKERHGHLLQGPAPAALGGLKDIVVPAKNLGRQGQAGRQSGYVSATAAAVGADAAQVVGESWRGPPLASARGCWAAGKPRAATRAAREQRATHASSARGPPSVGEQQHQFTSGVAMPPLLLRIWGAERSGRGGAPGSGHSSAAAERANPKGRASVCFSGGGVGAR